MPTPDPERSEGLDLDSLGHQARPPTVSQLKGRGPINLELRAPNDDVEIAAMPPYLLNA